MLISAVILSHNSERHLENCLQSILAALARFKEESEILVVENGSQDSSPEILRRFEAEHPGRVRGHFHDRNLGTTVSRNSALKLARGRFILVLDSDTYVPDGTLESLLSVLDRDATCGLVVPRLIYPDGRIQLSTDRFPTLGRKLARFFLLKRMEDRGDGTFSSKEPFPVDYAISAFWLLRREVLSTVGLLDERIFYSPEDVDYCISVWLAGYRILCDPSVHAVHEAQEVSRGRKLGLYTLRHALGLLYLFAKHRYFFRLSGLYRRIERAREQSSL